jgi:hypothetical protein
MKLQWFGCLGYGMPLDKPTCVLFADDVQPDAHVPAALGADRQDACQLCRA